MECPNCGRNNLASALRCDCGYNFQKKQEGPGKDMKQQAREIRKKISQRWYENRISDGSQDAHTNAQGESHLATSVAGGSAAAEESPPPQRKQKITMKDSLTILGAAAILALGLYFGLRERSAPPPPPPQPPPVSTPESSRTPQVTLDKMNIQLDDAQQVVGSIEEAFHRTGHGGKTGYEDIARHAKELVDLAQQVRSETAPLSREDSRAIRLLVDHVQHAAQELESAAETHQHEESHHAFENLEHELESLRKEVESLS